MPAACLDVLRRADAIVHAGDLSSMACLTMLRAMKVPVVAVAGNVEEPAVRRALPPTAEVDLGGVRLGVIHDAGSATGRLERMRRRFPRCQVVVFGHSHIPLHQSDDRGFGIVNPGSPTDRRRQPRASMAELVVAEDGRWSVDFWAVDRPAGPLADELVRR